MNMLKGKRILVTGAGGGIGGLLAARLSELGCQLVLVDLNEKALEVVADRTGQPARACDLGEAAERTALADWVADHYGALDGLVQCAGINAFGLYDQQTDAQIERLLRINLVAPIQLTRLFLPLLEKGQQPVIVSLGSVFGHIGFPGFSLYSASKFGLHGYTEALRRELSDGPVRVAWISPRATRTAMNQGVIDDLNAELKVNYDPPETVVSAIVSALANPQRERVLGFPEKLFARINQVFPGLVDGSLARQMPTIRKFSTRQKEPTT